MKHQPNTWTLITAMLLFAGLLSCKQLIDANSKDDDEIEIPSPKATVPSAPAEQPWIKFESTEGRYRTLFPAPPKKSVQQTPIAGGTSIALTMDAVELGEAYYAVSYADYPPSLAQNLDTNAVLDGARDGALKNINATLISEKQIQVGGHPAREIDAKAISQGTRLRYEARIFYVPPRLYQLIVVYPASATNVQEDRFFTSFALQPSTPTL